MEQEKFFPLKIGDEKYEKKTLEHLLKQLLKQKVEEKDPQKQ